MEDRRKQMDNFTYPIKAIQQVQGKQKNERFTISAEGWYELFNEDLLLCVLAV